MPAHAQHPTAPDEESGVIYRVIGSSTFKWIMGTVVAPAFILLCGLGIVSQVDKIVSTSTAVVAVKVEVDTLKVATAKLQATADDHGSQLKQAAITDARLAAGQEKMFTILKSLSDDVHAIDDHVGIVGQKVDDQALRITDLQEQRK